MVEEDETSPAVRVGKESPRAIKLCFHRLARSFQEERNDMGAFLESDPLE